MAGTMGNEGINKLAGVFQGRMHSMGGKPEPLDFGEIKGDMSLVTNRFPRPVPKSDYVVCRQLTLGAEGEKLAETDGVEGHVHEIGVPGPMRKVRPGDRVLVAWVGDDPCVVDVILSGDVL